MHTQTQPTQSRTINFSTPATHWEEGLLIGNAFMGAVIMGGTENECIHLNEETLYGGEPSDTSDPSVPVSLNEVRRLLFAGEYSAAQTLCEEHMQGRYTTPYLPLGKLRLHFDGHGHAEKYHRSLDLSSAIASTTYSTGDTPFRRFALASHPRRLMAFRFEADHPTLSMRIGIDCPLQHTVEVKEHQLILRGRCPYDVLTFIGKPHMEYDDQRGIAFTAIFDIRLEGGTLNVDGNALLVQRASAVEIRVSAATTHRVADPEACCRTVLHEAESLNWQALRDEHIADHQSLFNRVRLNIDSAVSTPMTTVDRLRTFVDDPSDLGLVNLLFDYGRYLMIASSRPGSQPATLQGVWNPHMNPPWWSNYTVNINTEMNYWPVEVCQLGECHTPLFDLLASLQENGRAVASRNYGCRGWVLHHQTDLFRGAHPRGRHNAVHRGSARWAMWPMGGAWLCCHLWEHYLHSGDRAFLKDTAWPLMKGAAEFLYDWLIQDDEGRWVTCPSSSPENDFVGTDGQLHALSIASTMDLGIIRQHFNNCIATCETLGVDAEFASALKTKLEALFPFQIGQHGQLQEWFQDWDRPDDKHRHISHLFALHPGHLITSDTPELFAAARRTLEMRGDDGTGWSKSWKISFWARLLEGDRAWSLLRNAMKLVQPEPDLQYSTGGGVYANLLCAHPPFQIDGNFGMTAGITEMLLQSHEVNAEGVRRIRLLPALPTEWASGSVEGLCARGGFIIDMSWREGRLQNARITSKLGEPAEFVYHDQRRTLRLTAGESIQIEEKTDTL